MQVIVSFKMEVGASASLHDMESQIWEAGRAAMKEALKRVIPNPVEPRSLNISLFVEKEDQGFWKNSTVYAKNLPAC